MGLLGLVAVLAGAACAEPARPPLVVSRYASSEISAHLNAYLIHGPSEGVLVDATMTVEDAEAVAEMVDAASIRLTTIFITNSQPDKYLGLAVLVARFPEARVVSTPPVVADIERRGARYHERLRARWGERIPDRLVVPDPLVTDRLWVDGQPIEVRRFQGGECPNAAALLLRAQGDFFAGAIVFEGSHLFLRERDIPGWRAHLQMLRGDEAIGRIHPGHGRSTDKGVLGEMERYLDDFEEAVALGEREAAASYMVERYPSYRLERLLREYSLPAYLRPRAEPGARDGADRR